jgi:hypothetical protein
MSQSLMLSIFHHAPIKRHFFGESHLLCIHAMPSFSGVRVLHVICIAHVDVGMVLLSRYYVPHWCVSFCAVGLAEFVTLL